MKHLKSTITLTAMALLAMGSPRTEATSLPPLINFQSVLLDEGGNLLPSGLTTVQFQILDENREAIYTETQSVEVTKGAVSTLVGNGTDSKGIATGGIPTDVFAAGAPRYLQVQVGTHAPEDPMTIVPVPYAQWSETCATVADGAVAGGKIAKAAVGFEHLAPDVVSKLAAEMSKSQGVVTAQSLNATGGATQIGVEAKFINSGSSTLQGVLQDIDLSVKKSQEMESFLTGKLNEEVTNRTNTVADVQTKLDQEVVNRTTADSGLQGQITKEIKDRGDAVAQEVTNRTTADGGLQGQITKEIKDRGDAVAQEVANRTTADSGLQGQITPIQNTLKDINNISGTLSLSKVQTSAPPPSDLNMGGHNITNLAAPVNGGDASTRNYVDVSVAGEAGARAAKDSTLQTQLNGHETRIQTLEKKPEPAVNPPNPANTIIKSGSYQGINGGAVTIDVGFKPVSIQIFSKDKVTDYFGTVIDATTIMGVAVSNGGNIGGNPSTLRQLQSLQLNGTKITIANGALNEYVFATYYYTIWGTE